MEKYKAANKENVDTNKDTKKDITEKAVNKVGEAALNFVPGGKAIKTLKNVPGLGNGVNKVWDNAVKKVSNNINNIPTINNLNNNSGVKNQNNSKINNSINKATNLFAKSSDKLKSSGILDGDLFKMIPKPLKIKIIICSSVIFLIMLIVFAVFAQDDIYNLNFTNGTENSGVSKLSLEEIKSRIKEISITDFENITDNYPYYVINNISDVNIDNDIELIKRVVSEKNISTYFIMKTGNEEIDSKLEENFSGKLVSNSEEAANALYENQGSGGLRSGNPENDLIVVANWFINNVDSYGTSFVNNPYPNGKSRKDCSGFAATYMSYVSDCDLENPGTLVMLNIGGSWIQKAQSCGWKPYNSSDLSALQPGDVLVGTTHTEVYVDESHTFGWGAKRTEYPLNRVVSKQNDGTFKDNITSYTMVYRYEGKS